MIDPTRWKKQQPYPAAEWFDLDRSAKIPKNQDESVKYLWAVIDRIESKLQEKSRSGSPLTNTEIQILALAGKTLFNVPYPGETEYEIESE